MTRVVALLHALELQVDVAERLPAEQLPIASPCAGWTVRQVLDYSLGVTRKFAEFASGATDEPHAPTGISSVPTTGSPSATPPIGAARVESSRHDAIVPAPIGTFAADLAAGINLFDVLAHTWDIAAAVGVELDQDDELWLVGLDAARAVVGEYRDPTHYDSDVLLAGPAPPMVRFLAFLGRTVPGCP